jgi:hypothetical protein
MQWIKLPAGTRKSHRFNEATESSICFTWSNRHLGAFERGVSGSACRAVTKLMEGDYKPCRGRGIAFSAKRTSSGELVNSCNAKTFSTPAEIPASRLPSDSPSPCGRQDPLGKRPPALTSTIEPLKDTQTNSVMLVAKPNIHFRSKDK